MVPVSLERIEALKREPRHRTLASSPPPEGGGPHDANIGAPDQLKSHLTFAQPVENHWVATYEVRTQ